MRLERAISVSELHFRGVREQGQARAVNRLEAADGTGVLRDVIAT